MRSEEMLREIDPDQPVCTSAVIAATFDGLSSIKLDAATSMAHVQFFQPRPTEAVLRSRRLTDLRLRHGAATLSSGSLSSATIAAFK